jgi:hypothetical protein
MKISLSLNASSAVLFITGEAPIINTLSKRPWQSGEERRAISDVPPEL